VNLSATSPSSSSNTFYVLPFVSSVWACTFRMIIPHQQPLSIIHDDNLSLTNFPHSTADKTLLRIIGWDLSDNHHSSCHPRM